MSISDSDSEDSDVPEMYEEGSNNDDDEYFSSDNEMYESDE